MLSRVAIYIVNMLFHDGTEADFPDRAYEGSVYVYLFIIHYLFF